MLTGRFVEADEDDRIGLVPPTVDDGALLSRAAERAALIVDMRAVAARFLARRRGAGT
jgi:enoyl-CoA hydratase/carnithine racemase